MQDQELSVCSNGQAEDLVDFDRKVRMIRLLDSLIPRVVALFGLLVRERHFTSLPRSSGLFKVFILSSYQGVIKHGSVLVHAFLRNLGNYCMSWGDLSCVITLLKPAGRLRTHIKSSDPGLCF